MRVKLIAVIAVLSLASLYHILASYTFIHYLSICLSLSQLGGNFAYEPEHMITGEDHPVCSLSQQTVKVLKKVFEDVVSSVHTV